MKIVEVLGPEQKESSLNQLKALSLSQGWDLQFQSVEFESLALPIPQWVEQQRKNQNVKMVRLDVETSNSLLSIYTQRPTTVNILANLDHLFFDKGFWWPQLFVFEALRVGMMHKVRAIDTLSCGYVVGSTELGMISVAVLIGMGIRKIYWLGEDLNFIKERIQNLRVHYVGVELNCYPASSITTLSDKGSVLICATSLSSKRDLLADLLYFNYIKKGGLVANIVGSSSKETFLVEAEKAELNPLSARDLNRELDWQLILKLGLGNKITYAQFQGLWNSIQPSSSEETP